MPYVPPRTPALLQRVIRHGARRKERAAFPAALAVPGMVLAALLVALVAGPAPVRAQSSEIAALLSDTPARYWPVLASWRANPAAAREALVQALGRDPPYNDRWRLVGRMIEFGTAEDLPLLLAVRAGAQGARERNLAEGALRALYDPVATPDRLESVVQDFSFLQTRAPSNLADSNRGKWVVTAWGISGLHREDLPLDVIRQAASMRGRGYDTREQLAEVMQKRVGPRDWKVYSQRLLNAVEAVPPRVQLEGLARVRLLNPYERPLLLMVSLDAWYGSFREPPGTAWVYLEPNATTTVDLPVAPQGALTRPHVRIDLRLREVDGPVVPGFHKLYLPLQP